MKIKQIQSLKSKTILIVLCAMCSTILMLAGCRDGVIVMPATHEATWIINDYTKDGPCDVFTVDRSGLAPRVRPTYDMPVIVGWTNGIQRGADPFPCNRRWHHEYQGLIKFDFQEDAAIRSLLESRRVVNADLVLHQHGIPGRSNLLGRTPVRLYRLTRLSSSWPAETRIAMSNLEPDIDLPPLPWPLEGNLRFDPVSRGPEIREFLTYTVQGWIDGTIPNHGLSITIGRDLIEAGWTDNEEFLHAYYAELELTLVPR